MNKKVMLVGEPLGLFIAQEEALLEKANLFSAAVAGAEFNVAMGLSRLNHSVDYLTKLGSDPFGKRIINAMQENKIGTSLVSYSKDYATGIMLKSKTSYGDPDIYYYRKNSAASTISIEDVEKINFTDYGILHVTGIFPALSSVTLETTKNLMQRAKKAGCTIFFDPNLRPQLWSDNLTMAKTINMLSVMADYVLPGYKEGEILCGTKVPEKIAEFYLKQGVKTVIVKTGYKGAYAATQNDNFYSQAFAVKKVVDTVGAGDGFAAGIISATAEGLSLKEAVKRGNAIGAMQVMSEGDNEGLPTREQLRQFIEKTKYDV